MTGVFDYLGREIVPGQTITYAGRRGSSLYLTRGVVNAVAVNQGVPYVFVTSENNENRYVRLTRTDLITIVH